MDLGYRVIEAVCANKAAALAADLPDIALISSNPNLAGEATGLDLLNRLRGLNRPSLLTTAMPRRRPTGARGAGPHAGIVQTLYGGNIGQSYPFLDRRVTAPLITILDDELDIRSMLRDVPEDAGFAPMLGPHPRIRSVAQNGHP